MKKGLIKAQQDFRKSENTSFDENLYRPMVEKLSRDVDAAQAYGKNLRHFRKRQGVTQEDLANVIGVSNVGIHKIEAGKSKKINVDYFFLFCHHLGIHPRQLLPLEESRDKESPAGSSTAVDPMRFYDEISMKKIRFIILQLWNGWFWLLYKLYLFSTQSEKYQNELLTALRLTFLKNHQIPSAAFFKDYHPEFEHFDLLNPDISVLYKMIPEANKKGPYILEEHEPLLATKERYVLYMDNIRSSRGAWEGYAISSVYEAAFENLMLTNPQLFDEFVKISSLDNLEKKRTHILLDCIEI